MKRIKIISWCLPVIFFCAFTLLQTKYEKKSKKVKVSGTVMHTGVFCGGARMPDNMLKEITEPKPLLHKKLFVKKGKENDFSKSPVLEFSSDSLGNFAISLPPGEYCIVDEFKKDKANYDDILTKHAAEIKWYSAVDKVCLAEWFKTPDAVLTVTKAGVKNFTIIYADKCPWNAIPCVRYTGPLPP